MATKTASLEFVVMNDVEELANQEGGDDGGGTKVRSGKWTPVWSPDMCCRSWMGMQEE